MTRKALTWIAVIATMAALAAPNIFAIDKREDLRPLHGRNHQITQMT